jgi:hypothetical protein
MILFTGIPKYMKLKYFRACISYRYVMILFCVLVMGSEHVILS